MSQNNKRIYIIESNHKLKDSLIDKLNTLDYEVVGASETGQDAVEELFQLHPDLVMIDLSLDSDMDGIETAKMIQERVQIPHVFIITSVDEGIIPESDMTNPAGYVVQPVDEEKLAVTLESIFCTINIRLKHSIVIDRLNSAITRKNIQTTQIMTLLNASAMINSSLDINEINKRTIESAMLLVNAEAASLLFLDENRNVLFFDVALGEKGDVLKTISIKLGEGIAGWVAEKRESLIINDPGSDPRFLGTIDQQSGFITRNIICLPVITKGKLLGVLEVINKKRGNFSQNDMDLLSALSNQIAVAIDNSKLYDELKSTLYSVMYTLAETIEKRDPYTGGHARRVRDYSLLIGNEMGLNEDELSRLEIAAILHDIGKIGVNDDILRKTERLNDEEYEAMKQHPSIGEDILRHIPDLKNIIPGVRHHHERYDGAGYPDGMRGDEIDIIARIISVADTYDAMTSDRSYRKRLDKQYAVKELQSFSGTQFDPDVVTSFIKCLQDYPDLSFE